MCRSLIQRAIAALAALLPVMAFADPASEIVVAIRYLQASGESHSHVYLYRDDSKFLRQLTDAKNGQDLDPIFAPDGESIVFTREGRDEQHTFWSVSPRGGEATQLAAAPDWYRATNTSPFFEWLDEPANAPPYGERSPTFRSPDGTTELVLREVKEDEDDTLNQPGHGEHYLLRDLRSGQEQEFGKLPGFEGAVEQLQLRGSDSRFLIEPPLRAAFFGVHLNSTDGDTSYALDLSAQRFVRLSPNWAAPIPLPGESAFLTLTTNRYVPIPGSKKRANCSSLERWDARLQKVRYARPDTAAICYGASTYRPGKTPAVVSLRRNGE